MNPTLGGYIARRFLGFAAGTFAAVFVLIALIDLVELLRRNSRGGADFADLVGLALLHAPAVAITAAPFSVLLAAMTCFGMFARSSELVVTRAAGISAWRLLAPAGLVALALGGFVVMVWNPVAAALAERYETLIARHFDSRGSVLTFSGGGLWLRQGEAEGQTVIRARGASGTGERLWSVTVFRFDAEDRLDSRIEARSAVLEPGVWQLHGVHRWNLAELEVASAGGAALITRPVSAEIMEIPTDLTPERIQESFAPPRTISFWELPRFIGELQRAGFTAARYRIHWQGLVALPVTFVAMVLIGAAFSMRHVRLGGLGYMALGCVMSGFAYFFLSDLATALGASGAVPVVIAAWAPPLAAMLFALGLLLHLEDG